MGYKILIIAFLTPVCLFGQPGGSGILSTVATSNITSDATKFPERDTVPIKIIVIDTTTGPIVFWMDAFSVREKHNTGENDIDPGFYHCIDKNGRSVPCYADYMKHLYYLDGKKQALSKSIIVIKSIDL